MAQVDLLIRQVRAGEIEAFAEIVRLFERPVWRVVATMLQEYEQSREVMQQVFVDAYVHLDQYRLGEDFGVWIKAIARNRVRQELRRLNRESNKLAGYRERLAQRLQEATSDRHEQVYLEALDACRQRLPEQSARVIHWRYVEGWSLEQIAAQLDMTRTAAEKMLSRVRLALRKCIETRLAST